MFEVRLRQARSRVAPGRSIGALVLAMALGLTSVIWGSHSATALTKSCNDGRGWTADSFVDGDCRQVNVCIPILTLDVASSQITWTWDFPARCPMDSIDAVNVLIEHKVALAPSAGGPSGTVTRLDTAGQRDPARSSGGSIPATCGPVAVTFTVISDAEIVATGSGRVSTAPCLDPASLNDPITNAPPLLGLWAGSYGSVGSVGRLYWAVFRRLPDLAGFTYWLARIDAGLTMREMAAIWTDLDEWTSTYGGAGDASFVRAIYDNVLGRRPDPSGDDYWNQRLSEGLDRSELVLLFSDSVEFRRRTNTA